MRFLLVLGLRLAALGMLAAGLSGLLAEPVSWKTGIDYFTGDSRALAGELSVERCAELTRLHKRQRTCAGALVEDHFGELVEAGLVITVAGLALFLVLGRLSRPSQEKKEETVEALLLTAASLAFVAAAAADLPAGLSGLSSLAPGSGRALLRGGVALLFGGWLAAHATRAWRGLLGG